MPETEKKGVCDKVKDILMDDTHKVDDKMQPEAKFPKCGKAHHDKGHEMHKDAGHKLQENGHGLHTAEEKHKPEAKEPWH